MSMIKEQAVQMIATLPDDNVAFLVEMIQRFMIPREVEDIQGEMATSHVIFMQELEAMRIKAKLYFPPDLECEKILEEAIDEKYSSFG